MKVISILYKNGSFFKEINLENLLYTNAQLLIGFGSREVITNKKHFDDIKTKFPNSEIVLCSSSGEIFGVEVYDETISLVAIYFESSLIKSTQINIDNFENSFDAGEFILNHFSKENLKMVFVLSDGGKVNGSELVKGLNSANETCVLITGGLAGDGTKFEQTAVGLNELPQQGKIVALGFYGEKLSISHGSLGGWESFGLERTVSKSKGNVLYEIDNKNALELYKNYLGKYVEELPGSALLFPLSMKVCDCEDIVVRTILSIDEKNKTMTFAGDIPEGSKVRFMKANFDRLVDAANNAANNCIAMNAITPKLAFLISCVGRKIILGNRIDEEVEAVADVFGKTTTLTGFYSYGEISPLKPLEKCELHNQTMTITCINEIE